MADRNCHAEYSHARADFLLYKSAYQYVRGQILELPLEQLWTHLSNEGERCSSQYTFVNPLETEADWFTDTKFVKKYMTHGSILKKYWF